MFLLMLILAFSDSPSTAATKPASRVGQKSAERLVLDTGEIVQVMLSRSLTPDSFQDSVILHANDGTIAATFIGNYKSKSFMVKLASGGRTVYASWDAGFRESKMPTPLVVEIDGERYRTLLDPAYDAQTVLVRNATAKLPRGFLDSLSALHQLGDDFTYAFPALNMLEEVIDGMAPPRSITERRNLTEAEAGALQERLQGVR